MNYLVLGLAKSGISSCNLLCEKGENVFAFDDDKKYVKEISNSGLVCSCVTIIKKLSKKVLKQIDKIVVSPGVKKDRYSQIASKYGIDVISELELGFQFCHCDVLAITGTNGKTTTTTLLGEMLKISKKDVFVVGNIGTAFCSEVQKMKNDSVAVCEASNFQLENIKTFKPKIVGFLNIAPDHLDRYKNFEEYFLAKLNIFKNFSQDDIAVLNFDDDLLRSGLENLNCKKIYFSLSKLPDLIDGAYLKKNEICFVKNGKIEESVSLKDLKLVGNHNKLNVMCAVLIARGYGVSIADISKAISNFKGLEHRIEYVGCLGNVKFYNDSKATNIHSTLTAVNSFSEDIVLLLGGSDKGENFSVLFSKLPKNVVKIITFGACGKKIYTHGTSFGFKNISQEENLESAFDFAVKNLNGNEVVLLSPATASFDEFKNYEERGAFFKYLVKELKE